MAAIREMTAVERMRVVSALGHETLRAADALRVQLNTYGKAPAAMWRKFLRALMEGAGATVMSSPLGLAIQLAIIGTIQGATNGNEDQGASSRSRGSGFPVRPR
jgi:hypothetical protein